MIQEWTLYVVIKTRYSNRLQELIHRSSFSHRVVDSWNLFILFQDN